MRPHNLGLLNIFTNLGVTPNTHPGELPATELMLLGALSVREAQLANMNACMTAMHTAGVQMAAKYLVVVAENNDLRHRCTNEMYQRYDAEDALSAVKRELDAVKQQLAKASASLNDIANRADDAVQNLDDAGSVVH